MKLLTIIHSLLVSLSPLLLVSQDTLTLGDAISTGLRENFSIILSRNNLEMAQSNNTIGNAGMLPEVTLNGTNNLFSGHTWAVYGEDDSTVTLTRTLFYANTLGDVGGSNVSNLSALSGQNPLLDPTYHLLSGSPAIETDRERRNEAGVCPVAA